MLFLWLSELTGHLLRKFKRFGPLKIFQWKQILSVVSSDSIDFAASSDIHFSCTLQTAFNPM